MILVSGATGLTGGAVVRRLSSLGVPVRAMVRDMAKAAPLATLPGVTLAVGDMARPETLAAAFAGVERAMVISSSAPDMVEVQANFIAAGVQAGVRHMVKLSGIMPERDSAFRFARMHGEIELVLERSGLPYTHLRAGEFMHSYFRQVPNILGKGILALPMAGQRIASIDVDDIAAIAATVLTGSGHEGKIYPITGAEALDMAEVAAILSEVAGKPIRYIAVPPEAAMAAQRDAGMPPYMVEALAELFAERRDGKEATVWPDAARLLGRAPTSLRAFAQRHAAIFKGESPAPRL